MATRGNKLRDIDYTLSDLEKEVNFSKKTLSNKISSICEEAGIEQYKIRSNESEKGDYLLLFEWYELLKLLIEFEKENPFGRKNPSKNKKLEDIETYYEKIFSRIDQLPQYMKCELEASNYYKDNKKLPVSMKTLIDKISELVSAIFLIASDEQVEFMDYISKSIDGWINTLYVNRTTLNLAIKDYARVSGCEYTDLKFYSIVDLLMEMLKLMVDRFNCLTIENKQELYEYVLDESLSKNTSIEEKRMFFKNILESDYNSDFKLDNDEEEILIDVIRKIGRDKRDKDFISMKKEMMIKTKKEIDILKRKLELIEEASDIDELVDATTIEYYMEGKALEEFKKQVKENTYKYSDDVNRFIVSIITNNYIK